VIDITDGVREISSGHHTVCALCARYFQRQ